MALVEIEDVTFHYPGQEKAALREVSLRVDKGEFVLLTGHTGCGKTTLLRLLNGLVPHFHGGRIRGRVTVAGRDVFRSEPRELASLVGMVFQDAEGQLVSTTVEKEIAFGMENAGLPQAVISKRVEEMLVGLGLSRLRRSFIPELSGGEKQKTVLASIMAMHPLLLVLDEPTSQLDPLSAEDLLTLVRRLHEETGTTVMMCEHRLERCYHYASRVLYMETGRILFDGDPREAAAWCAARDDAFMPPVTRVFARAGWERLPLTVNEGRRLLAGLAVKDTRGDGGARETVLPLNGAPEDSSRERPHGALQRAEGGRGKPSFPSRLSMRSSRGGSGPQQDGRGNPAGERPSRPTGEETSDRATEQIFNAQGLWFVYPGGPEALRGLHLHLHGGTGMALLGENGAGKSTLIRCLLGLLSPSRGKVTLFGDRPSQERLPALAPRLGYCPQNPSSYFVCPTVREELLRTMRLRGHTGKAAEKAVDGQLELMDIAHLARRNPHDLSAGEREKVLLASVLLPPLPELLVLDEPTRGLDHGHKRAVAQLLREYRASGGTAFVVTHDVEFAASLAERAAIMGNGAIVCEGSAYDVLGDSLFFSPQVNRLLSGSGVEVLREEEAVYILKGIRGAEGTGNGRT